MWEAPVASHYVRERSGFSRRCSASDHARYRGRSVRPQTCSWTVARHPSGLAAGLGPFFGAALISGAGLISGACPSPDSDSTSK